MKIIKPGREQKGWSTEATCTGDGNGGGGCGATLLVEQADLFITTSQARDETTEYVTFSCMACGVLTDLGKGKLPPYAIRQALPTKNPRNAEIGNLDLSGLGELPPPKTSRQR